MYRFYMNARRMAKSTNGSLSVLFVFSITVLLLSAGIAVSLGAAWQTQKMLQAATDSAATAAASAVMKGNNDATLLTKLARNFVYSNISLMGADYSNPDITVAISNTVPKKLTVKASVNMIPYAAGILGVANLPISAKTVVTLGGGQTYYQIAFLIDNSGSMSIGGTEDDIFKLESDPKTDCAFACHDPNKTRKVTGSAVYDKSAYAASVGIKLKFDYVESAVKKFLAQIEPAMLQDQSQFLVSIWNFATYFQNFQPFTNDTVLLQKQVANLELEIAIAGSKTGIANGMTEALKNISNVGDGSSPAKRKTYLILITDGVEDSSGKKSPINPTDCAKVKAANIGLIAVQTTYPTNLDDKGFIKDVLPILPTVTNNMKSCASTADLYFSADDGPSIEKSMQSVSNALFGNLYVSE